MEVLDKGFPVDLKEEKSFWQCILWKYFYKYCFVNTLISFGSLNTIHYDAFLLFQASLYINDIHLNGQRDNILQ